MVQWFKKLITFFTILYNKKNKQICLDIQGTEERVRKAALTIHAYSKDEAILAVREVLKAQETRSLYSLAMMKGSLEELHRIQGQLQAIGGLLTFLDDAAAMRAEQVKDLRAKRQDEIKSKILHMGARPKQDTVI
jgi:ribosomal protein S2